MGVLHAHPPAWPARWGLATVHVLLSDHGLLIGPQRSLLCQSPECPRGDADSKQGSQVHGTSNRKRTLHTTCHDPQKTVSPATWESKSKPRPAETRAHVLFRIRRDGGEHPALTLRGRKENWMMWKKMPSNTGTELQMCWVTLPPDKRGQTSYTSISCWHHPHPTPSCSIPPATLQSENIMSRPRNKILVSSKYQQRIKRNELLSVHN